MSPSRFPRFYAAALLPLLAACSTEYRGLEEQVPDYWLQFALERDEVQAGEGVGYTAEIASSEGGTTPVEVVLESDQEPLLWYDASSLRPVVAGEQQVTAWAEWEGETYSATATLLVGPGEPARVDLQLEDYQLAAGGSVGWSAGLWDAWGNALDPAVIEVAADSPELSLSGDAASGGTATSTVPGTYHLLASVPGAPGVEDEEALVVVAGEPAAIELTLSDTSIELYETVQATVRVWDEYGNPVDADWDLYVEGLDGADPSTVAVAYDDLTFWDEGLFNVVASVQSSAGPLEDRVGPLLVDSTGPDLQIDTPTHGDWATDPVGQVAGTVTDRWSGVASLTVDGELVVPAADGSFSTEVDWDFGTNLLETVAVDGDGNATDDLRAVLEGDFLAYGDGLDDGIQVRVNQGGFDEISRVAEELVGAQDLDDLIPSPVYSNEQEYCVDLGWFGTYCYTLYSVDLYITNPSISGTDVSIDPQPGKLHTVFTVYDPSLDWSASGVVSEIGYSGSGDIYADSITVSMDLVPSISGGSIHVAASNVSVSSAGFHFGFDSWLYDVLDFFGVDIDGIVQGYMEDALAAAIEDQVPSMIEDALQGLELGTALELAGNTYQLDALPCSVSVDDDGLTLGLETWFTADNWLSPYTGLGSLYAGYPVPSYGATPDMEIGLSLDFLNQLLYALWGGGLLQLSMDGEELGVDISSLQLLFPDVEQLYVEVEPLLPPVVLPGTADAMDFQLGDLLVSLYGADPASSDPMLQAYLDVEGELSLEVEDEALLPELDGLTVRFDVVVPESNTLGAAETEDFLEALVPLFLPLVTDALSAVPLPSMQGFSLEDVSVTLDGGTERLAGDLFLE